MSNNFTDTIISEFLPKIPKTKINFTVDLNTSTSISELADRVKRHHYSAGHSEYVTDQNKKARLKLKENTFVELVSLGAVELTSTQVKITSATNSKNYFCDIPYRLIQPKQSTVVLIYANDVKKENKNKPYNLSGLTLSKLHDNFLKQNQFYSTYMPDNAEHKTFELSEKIFAALNTEDISSVFKLSSNYGVIVGGTVDGYFVKIEYEQAHSMIVDLLISRYQCKPENNFSIELNYDNSDSENSIENLRDLPDVKGYLENGIAEDNIQWIERTINVRGQIKHSPRRVGTFFIAFDQGRSIINATNASRLTKLHIFPGTTWANKQDSCTLHIGTGDTQADLKSADGKITYEIKYNKSKEKAIEECNNAKNTPTYLLISPFAGGEVSCYKCEYEGGKMIGASLIGTEKIDFNPIDLGALDGQWQEE